MKQTTERRIRHLVRTVYTLTLGALALCILVGRPASAYAETTEFSTLLIGFRADVTEAQRAVILDRLDAHLLHWLPQIHVAEVAVPRAETAVSAASLAVFAVETPGVLFAEPDQPVTGAHSPNDPDFADAIKSYAPRLLALPEAWELTAGSSDVVIALLDTGLLAAHPEFEGRVVAGYDFINEDSDPADDNGHGTHAAGIIAAAMDNHAGTAGVCPMCRIMPVKVLNAHNGGNWAAVARGILFAADNGARVINLSLGGAQRNHAVEAAVSYAQDRGLLVVAAAGNQASSEPFYPAALAGVLAVGATDEHDILWSLSNVGETIDLVAPGHLIYSTYLGADGVSADYTMMSGTSMAAPHVAGVAGLLFSQDLTRTGLQVSDLLTTTADDLGDIGKDTLFGAGRVNARRALAAETTAADTSATQMHAIFLPMVSTR